MLFDCASRNLKTACAPAGVLVVVADGTRCRLLVPDMLGERGDLAQLVVGEEIRAVRLAEVEGDLQRVIGIDRGAQDVVGVLAGRVAGPVLLVGSHEVLPELDVTRGDLCAVRPLPAFQGDRHRLAVRGIHGWIREAEAVVQQHLPVLTEPVQRAVHEELELAQVRDAEILQARERQDVVRLRSRAFSERRSRLRDLRTRRSVAGAPARGNDEHRTESEQRDDTSQSPCVFRRHIRLLREFERFIRMLTIRNAQVRRYGRAGNSFQRGMSYFAQRRKMASLLSREVVIVEGIVPPARAATTRAVLMARAVAL